jgi:hypothetical protein
MVERSPHSSDGRVTHIVAAKQVRQFMKTRAPELALHPLVEALRLASAQERSAISKGIHALARLTEPGLTEPGLSEPRSIKPGSIKPGSIKPGSIKPGLIKAALSKAALNNAGRRRLRVVRSLPATTQSVVLREGAGSGSCLLEEGPLSRLETPDLQKASV